MDPQQPQEPQRPEEPQQPQPPPSSEPPAQPGGWNQAPPQQPGWAPQQPGGPGWGQGAYSAAPPRPGGVTFAGIFLIVVGVLVLLASLLVFLGGAAFGGLTGDMGELGGLFAGMLTVLAVILLIWGLAHLLGGIGALQGKNWGRVTGIVISVIAVVLGVLGLLGSLGAPDMQATGLIINVVVLLLYAAAAWALIKAGPYFAYRR